MDTDGFPLSAISEKSFIDDTDGKKKSSRRTAPLRPADSNGGMEHGDISRSNIISKKQSDTSELREIEPEITENDNTMYSSYTAGGGDNDIIEIHQFSLADIDAYLNIYFETLNYRLRRYIGNDEQIQQFRTTTKNRISTNTNAREYQNVLLGKMNTEVVAAVTMSFPGEQPTIPFSFDTPDRNTCLSGIHRWLAKKSNYIPTNSDECYIEMIGVKQAHRNQGIGAAMLECVEQFARQAGAKSLTIHTPNQQLQTYFERFGFNLDPTDNSSFWKWIVERQSHTKLSKALILDGEDNLDFSTESYINESLEE